MLDPDAPLDPDEDPDSFGDDEPDDWEELDPDDDELEREMRVMPDFDDEPEEPEPDFDWPWSPDESDAWDRAAPEFAPLRRRLGNARHTSSRDATQESLA